MQKKPARFFMCPGCGLHAVLLSGRKQYALSFTKRGARKLVFEWWQQDVIGATDIPVLIGAISTSPLPERQHSCQKSIRYLVTLDPSYGYKPPPQEVVPPQPAPPPPAPPRPQPPATIFIEGKTQPLN